MKVVLTHVCNHPKYSGTPGDVVDVPDEVAAVWFTNGGAREFVESKDKKATKAAKPATADESEEENEAGDDTPPVTPPKAPVPPKAKATRGPKAQK